MSNAGPEEELAEAPLPRWCRPLVAATITILFFVFGCNALGLYEPVHPLLFASLWAGILWLVATIAFYYSNRVPTGTKWLIFLQNTFLVILFIASLYPGTPV